ncbi:mechanosensitive ion channel protein MscS [Candidatus Uhrbacteria bacterium CG_4_10_14_0_8_um_filter_58_22]|uniref:Mechanosensitive ion channel protein MscS n=1 Tax=Candidatus Uhrbacteria bacterium CG_4_10_14_0_8_um_filter_58_22 TaxID=1975029 RepID=A0A2M7QC86_9BACT|nr:MAG: hypothetical protein AUJ19_02720 [Parcubacteria group bacterium CG1_02_58_44]PIY63401.1 MAG: mechanosensitive ion channel protein MscS [Candidatus Uhrbacteria bacterium CG_4_10_14_0_8_um_filter_58_22]
MLSFLEPLRLLAIGRNTAYDYLLAFGIFLAVVIGLKLIQTVVLIRLRRLAERTKTKVDDAVIEVFERIRPPFYGLVALYLAVRALTLPSAAESAVGLVFGIVLAIEVSVAFGRLTDRLLEIRVAENDGTEAERAQLSSVLGTVGRIVKALVWIVAALMLLANLGVNVTSLVASLGIGGIAIALALQNVLGDLFSSVSILIDKPFVVGDLIVVGEHTGNIERIGLKSTRLRTPLGEELIISNRELTDAHVRNFGRLHRRRALFTLGVTYGTPSDKLRRIPEIMRGIVAAETIAEFDRCHFVSYGDSSLDFEVAFYANTSDYGEYLDLLQSVNLAVYDAFAAEGIGFAFPTRTIISAQD